MIFGEKRQKYCNDALLYEEIPVEQAVEQSEHLAKSPKYNVFRRTFFRLLSKKKYSEVAKILFPKNYLHKTIRRIYGVFCYIYEFIIINTQ